MCAVYINEHLKNHLREQLAIKCEDNSTEWWGCNTWGRGGNFYKRQVSFRSEHDVLLPSYSLRYILKYELGKEPVKSFVEMQVHASKSSDDLRDLLEEIKDKLKNNSRFVWNEKFTSCKINQEIFGWDDAKAVLQEMQETIDPIIKKFVENEHENSKFQIKEKVLADLDLNNNVELRTLSLHELLSLKLTIPDYQRIYCWEEETIRILWNDINDSFRNEQQYRLGTIILQNKDFEFQIIDGQQRLVTLSLIINALKVEGIKLLEQKYQSAEAFKYIAYNKYFIKTLLKKIPRGEKRDLANKMLRNIEFSVLILNEKSYNLAYTFFSNENSKGISLSDFDLLKAHHLRFLTDNIRQSKFLARKWDMMILDGSKGESENKSDIPYIRTLSIYIFRLRQWIRNKQWDDSEKYRVKKEYEAAPTITEIPPFGENFYWNESIQGGSHFFSYVDRMVNQFAEFSRTEQYRNIHEKLNSGSNQWYRDVIESLLFGYFLKFGLSYLTEAMFLIATKISQDRYENKRANKNRILYKTANFSIVYMIDRATSPTFFLAELMNDINSQNSLDIDNEDMIRVQKTYRIILDNVFSECEHKLEISRNMILNDYERY